MQSRWRSLIRQAEADRDEVMTIWRSRCDEWTDDEFNRWSNAYARACRKVIVFRDRAWEVAR